VWFPVPLFAIDEAIVRTEDGSITGCIYDPRLPLLSISPRPGSLPFKDRVGWPQGGRRPWSGTE